MTETDETPRQNSHDSLDDTRPLPEGWRWVRLGDVGHFESGGTPSKDVSDYWGGRIPFVTGADITELHVSAKQARAFLTDAGLTSGKTAICRPGTVLFVTRTRVGRVGIATETMGASQDLSPFICGPETYPEYVCWYLLGISDVLMANCRGSTIQGLTRDFVHALRIPLPSLAEQQRIAVLLAEQMAAVARARAAAEARVEAAKELPAAYLRAVFEGEQTKEWPRVRLGNACQLLPSKSIATDGDTEVRAITTACLTESGFRPSGAKVARMWADDAAESIVSPGEVLVARSNTAELVGRATMFAGKPQGAVASDLTIRIWPGSEVMAAFLSAYLSFLFLSGFWKERAGGASGSMKKITRSHILELHVPLPSTATQQYIVATLNEQMAAAEQSHAALQAQLDAITALPAALLRRAFSGAV